MKIINFEENTENNKSLENNDLSEKSDNEESNEISDSSENEDNSDISDLSENEEIELIEKVEVENKFKFRKRRNAFCFSKGQTDDFLSSLIKS